MDDRAARWRRLIPRMSVADSVALVATVDEMSRLQMRRRKLTAELAAVRKRLAELDARGVALMQSEGKGAQWPN